MLRNDEMTRCGLKRSPGYVVEPGADVGIAVVRIGRQSKFMLNEDRVEQEGQREVGSGETRPDRNR